MGNTVYGDVLFLVDFSMDFLCFFLTARLRGRRLFPLRTAAASALGGLYSVARVVWDRADAPPWQTALFFLTDAAVMFLLCAVAAGDADRSAGALARMAGTFFAVSCLVGGCMTAFSALFDRLPAPDDALTEPDGLPVWLWAIFAALASAVAFGWSRRKSAPREVRVTLRRGGREDSCPAAGDGGNLLRERVGGRGVLVCELGAAEDLFPPELVEFWRRGGRPGDAAALPRELPPQLRFIPAHTAAGEDTVLCAAQADEFRVTDEHGEHRADLLIAPMARRVGTGGTRGVIPATGWKE